MDRAEFGSGNDISLQEFGFLVEDMEVKEERLAAAIRNGRVGRSATRPSMIAVNNGQPTPGQIVASLQDQESARTGRASRTRSFS